MLRKLEISQLVNDTVFYFEGNQYKLYTGTAWSSPYCGECLGVQGTAEKSIKAFKCYQKLGGQYQTNIECWITVDTIVDVTNDAIIDKAKKIISDKKKRDNLKQLCEEAGICQFCGEEFKDGTCANKCI